MKKCLYFCVSLIAVFFMTGCSNQTLKCSKDDNENDGMSMHQGLNVSFKNDKVSNFVFVMNVSIDEQLISNNPDIANNLADSASSEFDNIREKNGVSYSMSKKDNGFNSKLKVNFNKTDNETMKSVSYLINHQASYSVIKNDLEKSGYSCK